MKLTLLPFYSHAHSVLKTKIGFLSRQLREMMCKRLLGVHQTTKDGACNSSWKKNKKKTMNNDRTISKFQVGFTPCMSHTQRGVKRSRSNNWFDSAVQQRAIFLKKAEWREPKSHAPSMLNINQMCFGVEIDTPTQEKGSRAAWVQLMTRFAGASNQCLSADCHKFTFPWRVKEKRSKMKIQKKGGGREGILITITTREEPRESGAHVSLTSTHHTTRAFTITEQHRAVVIFYFFILLFFFKLIIWLLLLSLILRLPIS